MRVDLSTIEEDNLLGYIGLKRSAPTRELSNRSRTCSKYYWKPGFSGLRIDSSVPRRADSKSMVNVCSLAAERRSGVEKGCRSGTNAVFCGINMALPCCVPRQRPARRKIARRGPRSNNGAESAQTWASIIVERRLVTMTRDGKVLHRANTRDIR